MRRGMARIMVWCCCLLGVLTASSPAFAQQEGDESGEQVMVLKFETFDVSTPVMDLFYRSLSEGFKAHPNKRRVPGGEVTINEMMLSAGCDGVSKECLMQLRGMLEADQLLFGSVQQSDGIYLFTINLFDFETGEFEARLQDQTVQGGMKQLEVAIPALVDSLFFGDIGELEVAISGVDSATLLFDGEERGQAPTKLEGLPLGEHVITVRTADGREQSRKVILGREEPSRVNFEFEPTVSDSSGGGIQRPWVIPGWALVGLGVVGAGVGLQQHAALQNLDDSATARFGGQQGAQDAAEAEQIRQVQSDLDRTYTRRNIAFAMGGASLVAGGALLYMAYTGDTESEETASSEGRRPLRERVSVGVLPGRTSSHVQLHLSF